MIENDLNSVAWARRILRDTDSGREAARAFFYACERGLPRCLTGRFEIPTCGDWECLTPEHQTWIGSGPAPGPSQSPVSSERRRV